MLVFLLLAMVTIAALQAAMFYALFTPRIEQANAQLYVLGVENSQRSILYKIDRKVRVLVKSAPDNDAPESTLAGVWKDFENHFNAAPRDALDTLLSQLQSVTTDAAAIDELVVQVERLQIMYADSYKDLLADLRAPPAYLWPTGPSIAKRSGYRQVVTLNRALYLAQTGEIGTARVILAGLNAAVDDPKILATVYYTLGRLQFELFRATPEVEYYTASIHYLRQALAADPGQQLAKRLLDFLLSLPAAETAPQSPDGRPETASEGAGAAISAEQRIF